MTGRILIVDDVATNRLVLKVKLAAAHYEVLVAENGTEALRMCHDHQPDLVLMDVMMPDTSGVNVCRDLKDNPATHDIPVILFTAIEDPSTRIEGLRAGADDFLVKPIDEVALLARLRSLLRTRDQVRELRLREATCAELGFADPARTFDPQSDIAMIAPDLTQAQDWRTRISKGLSDRIHPITKDAAFDLVEGGKSPDLFVVAIDIERSNDGLRLMSDLRSRAATRHAAIIVVLPENDSERAATALDLGAADICYSPFVASEIAVRIRAQLARKRRADRLRATLDDSLRLAVIDPLTGLYNRRYGMRHLARIAHRSKALGTSAAVIMVDIDHFKSINDTWGHIAGDAVLANVAEAMREGMRSEDLIFRIGGEEFLIVLPDTALEHARTVAERVRATIDALRTACGDGQEVGVTLSLGITDLSAFGFDVDKTLTAADKALYGAKRKGRNAIAVTPA